MINPNKLKYNKNNLKTKTWDELFRIYNRISKQYKLDKIEQNRIKKEWTKDDMMDAIVGAQIPRKQRLSLASGKNMFNMFK